MWTCEKCNKKNILILVALAQFTFVLSGCSHGQRRTIPAETPAVDREQFADVEFADIRLHVAMDEKNDRVVWHVNEVDTTEKEVVLDLLARYRRLHPTSRVVLTSAKNVPHAGKLRSAYLVGRSGLALVISEEDVSP